MSGQTLARRIQQSWDSKLGLSLLLLPASWLYGLLIFLRRRLYRAGFFKSSELSVPVIVVGNITVGGTGKTPVCAWLAKRLAQRGYKPGIILRGYGGASETWPILLDQNTSAELAGDEAVLLYRLTGLPVAAGPNRIASARQLISERGCDVIVSDDGLQHYALHRDVEIAIVDQLSGFQNKRLLPAGPLRESVSRMKSVDFVLNKAQSTTAKNTFCLQPARFVAVADKDRAKALSDFDDRDVIAMAATGNPQSFFQTLNGLNIRYEKKVFPDHYAYVAGDLNVADDKPIIMTQKDAVKCEHFAGDNVWYLEVEVAMSDATAAALTTVLNKPDRFPNS